MEHVESIRIERFLNVTPQTLGVRYASIPLRFCEYKITNSPDKMLSSETSLASVNGFVFLSVVPFTVGTLMRLYVDLPDYWLRKSKFVEYCHTTPPEFFQVLSYVVRCEATCGKYEIVVEHVVFDEDEKKTLDDYLMMG